MRTNRAGAQALTLTLTLAVALAGAVGCKDKGGDDTGDGGTGDGGAGDGGTGDGGTGDGGVGDGGTTSCTVAVDETEPEDGDTGWYWRDALEVTLDGATDSLSFSLVDSSGTAIALTDSSSEGGLVHTLTPGAGMTGMETYTLTIEVCGDTQTVTFQTDEFGQPLESPANDLAGNTYYFDLPGATFVQPVGVGALLATFLDVPILVGFTAADETMVDLLGAQAARDADDEWVQDTDQLTWDFPAAGFEEAPFFQAIASEIVIGYSYGGDLYEIPVYEFQVEGTIAADGQSIGGGRALGQGDTRNMGPLLGAGEEPTALCEMLADIGLVCEACPDGEMSCLTLEVLFPEAPLMADITLVEVEAR